MICTRWEKYEVRCFGRSGFVLLPGDGVSGRWTVCLPTVRESQAELPSSQVCPSFACLLVVFDQSRVSVMTISDSFVCLTSSKNQNSDPDCRDSEGKLEASETTLAITKQPIS